MKVNYQNNAAVALMPLLKKPTSSEELDELIESSLELSDLVNDDPSHPYAPLLDVIEDHIEEYENKNIRNLSDFTTPEAMLVYFMDRYGVTQNDLIPIFGNQGNVSKIIHHKGRRINEIHAAKLGKYFGVSPEIFLPPV